MKHLLAWYCILASAHAASEQRGEEGDKCRKTSVAILGAGVAGITAAQALANASIEDFVIIERNDYIGGRMLHTTFGKKPDGSPYTVELGANWVQGLGSEGGPENPIWTFAKKHQVENAYSNYSSILTFDETGENDFSGLLDTFENAYASAEQNAGYILKDNLQDTSARAGFSLAGWKPKKDMKYQAVEWWEWDWETSYTPEESGFLFGITGYNLTFYQFSDENNFVFDQRGFNTWLIGEAGAFLSDGDARLLLLNTTVKGISYSNEAVKVQTADGECIEAEYAICTFSLGVLQNEIVEFNPPFPRWKQEAIEQFQMGTYTKIFLQFKETFWDPDTQFFLYADSIIRGYYPVWQSLSAPGFLENSNIIFATVVGKESYRIEKQSDEETKAEAMAVLRTMFPDQDIPEPIDFLYPRWSQKEWSYGSYSNWPVGMTLEKHQNIRANLDRLWFAGEANSAEYFGFLHGAWFEAREVGERIAGLLGGDDNCTEAGDSRSMARYEVLRGTTQLDEYNAANGWSSSSFLTFGFE
ncbi:putative flavin-containing polyamine oxidase [Pseudomassariella vexata]|uniref:Putative flavin-containing polyamine oxidase n=1 Tax=Pseudomassariella vexata TaxID=1141098 RepID=A0A1Y2EA92_9PEZI|nr:putative flavin-containing polyamine oxidase [Pseudomassariella vexata]ORY68510.1 putative flavin-containing polyamine oxidase [Pseudomassariella vexata]